MPLLLGQLIYTSFPGLGFRALASAKVPTEIQQAFIQQVVYQHWDSLNPPRSGYRAAYLHQVASEHTLFGWLYNDGLDDLGRSHVPYFVCYYLAGLLQAVQLENIFTCLHRGPVALIDRQSLPSALETIVAPDLWSYQPARIGVAIPSGVRERSYVALKQRRLLDLFIPVDEWEKALQPPDNTGESNEVQVTRSEELTPVKLLKDAGAARKAKSPTPTRTLTPVIRFTKKSSSIASSNITHPNFVSGDSNSWLPFGIAIAMGLGAVMGVLLYAYIQLNEIRTLKTEAKYEECITKAELEYWAAETLFYKDTQGLLNECRLERARTLGAAEKFSTAIKAAERIPANSPLYPEAQKLIREWLEI